MHTINKEILDELIDLFKMAQDRPEKTYEITFNIRNGSYSGSKLVINKQATKDRRIENIKEVKKL